MRTSAAGLGLILVMGLAPVALAQATVTVGALAQHGDQYDHKTVAVVGTVGQYQERVSRAGNPYTVFKLENEGAVVSVYARGHWHLKNGMRVKVSGTFDVEHRVGRYTFRNEITAFGIEGAR
jgi:hypothetical protein